MIIGGRVNETFISKAYDDIVKELVEKFLMEINKDKVKNQQKTLKKNFMNAMIYLKMDCVVLDGMIL